MKEIDKKALNILNLTVFLQQQRYTAAVSFLFYLHCGLTLSDFLLFQSIFYYTRLLAETPSGYIADIFPRKFIIILSYILFTFRLLLWLFIPSYFTLLLGEIFYGLSKSFYIGASDGYMYDYLKKNNKQNKMLDKFSNFNFFMSFGSAASCLLGAYLVQYTGFSALFGFEIFLNFIAIIILLFLPNIEQYSQKLTLKKHYENIIKICYIAIRNKDIKYYIIYTSILFGITGIFVWNFQPLMKDLKIPVYLFGVVYFINHMLRAIGSLNAKHFIKRITLPKIGLIVWLLYSLCLLLLIMQLFFGNNISGFILLTLICISIGFYIIFYIGNLSRIHKIIKTNSRATVSSFASMLSVLFAGTFLLVFKNINSYYSPKAAVFVFLILFLLSGLLIKKIYLTYDKN